MQIGKISVNAEGFKGLSETEARKILSNFDDRAIDAVIKALKKGKYLKAKAKKSEEGGE